MVLRYPRKWTETRGWGVSGEGGEGSGQGVGREWVGSGEGAHPAAVYATAAARAIGGKLPASQHQLAIVFHRAKAETR